MTGVEIDPEEFLDELLTYNEKNEQGNSEKVDFGYWGRRNVSDSEEIAEMVVEETREKMPEEIDIRTERKGVHYIVRFKSSVGRISPVNDFLRDSGIAQGADEFCPVNGYVTELWFAFKPKKSEVERLKSEIDEQFAIDMEQVTRGEEGYHNIQYIFPPTEEERVNPPDDVDEYLYHSSFIESPDEDYMVIEYTIESEHGE